MLETNKHVLHPELALAVQCNHRCCNSIGPLLRTPDLCPFADKVMRVQITHGSIAPVTSLWGMRYKMKYHTHKKNES